MKSSTKLLGERDIPELKISAYLLNVDHPDGTSKAKFFGDYGFDIEKPQVLADAIHAHAELNEVEEVIACGHGIKHVVRCHLPTPDGRNPCIRVIWIREPGCETHRLVTAYPATPVAAQKPVEVS